MIKFMDTITEKEEKIATEVNSPKVVVVHNDDFNTFDHVQDCLVKICKLDRYTAANKTLEIHHIGKSVVAEGDDSHLKKIKLQLRAQGLSATIENA